MSGHIKSNRHNYSMKNNYVIEYVFRKVAHRLLNEGLLKVPPVTTKEIQDWCIETYAARKMGYCLKKLEELKLDPKKQITEFEISLLEDSIGELKKYTNRTLDGGYFASRNFRIDPAGWEYEKIWNKLTSSEKSMDKVEMKAGADIRYIHATMWFDAEKYLGYLGEYRFATNEIAIVTDVETLLYDVDEKIQQIKKVVRHEMQHFGQNVIGTARMPAFLSSKSTPHAERKVEFDPRIADEVDTFMQDLKNLDEDIINTYGINRLIQVYTDTGPTDLGLVDYWPSRDPAFFKAIKKLDVNKWKRAVRTFSAEVKRRMDQNN